MIRPPGGDPFCGPQAYAGSRGSGHFLKSSIYRWRTLQAGRTWPTWERGFLWQRFVVLSLRLFRPVIIWKVGIGRAHLAWYGMMHLGSEAVWHNVIHLRGPMICGMTPTIYRPRAR